jgi:3D-(3,5/4)-trihydroxycyclohexane-1,2-dione acylhydrolase (decyclizing)
MTSTRMTVSQALATFLSRQWTVDGDHRERLIAGTFGIFGHGNVAGLGQAVLELERREPGALPYHQARNEQAMVHQAVAYGRLRRRRGTFACLASVGPGSTNMLTGAALATINRLPVLLLPSDTFATRVADPVLQQLEQPGDATLSVNDAFRPLSRFFDRVQRPEQLFSAALGAMRVLTDPVDTGAVTIALPEDVQAEALDVPEEFLAPREWVLRRPAPEAAALAAAVAALRAARRPLIIAGGGVIYSDAAAALVRFAEATGIPVATTQAGTGSIPWSHALALGGVGATGTPAANRAAEEADLVIGVGTRYSDFTTASRSAFQHPGVRFLNINVAAFDAYKHGTTLPLVADARVALEQLTDGVGPLAVDTEHATDLAARRAAWDAEVDSSFADAGRERPAQSEVVGAVLAASDPRDVVVCAAGSLPGDLHRLWRVRDDLGYHVEYGFSCMGYEIAGGLGARRAAPDRDVVVMVGDGSYLMMHTELVTAVAEGLKVIVVLIQNHGYASIGRLSESVGSERFGTAFRSDGGDILPVDLATNAESLGVRVIRLPADGTAIARLGDAVRLAKASDGPTVIHVETDPLLGGPDGGGWWDVPVAEVSGSSATRAAREQYVAARAAQRPLVGEEIR